MQQCECVLQTLRKIAAALCALNGLGLLSNKRVCGFGYPHALLAELSEHKLTCHDVLCVIN